MSDQAPEVATEAGRPGDGTLAIRFYLLITGILAGMCGVFFLVVAALRALNQGPVPRPVTVVFSAAFLLSYLLVGACLVMLARSDRLWKSTS